MLNNEIISFLSFSDILRRLEAVSQELHPSVHRNQELIPLHPLESMAESLRLFGHEPILRLHRYGHDPIKLRVLSHDRDCGGSRVSILINNWRSLLSSFIRIDANNMQRWLLPEEVYSLLIQQ